MSSLKQQLFSFIGMTGIYVGVLALLFPNQLTSYNSISIGVVLIVFILSTLITSTGKIVDAQANAQKFLLGTTVQIMIALFYVLFSKYLAKEHFKTMSIHFLVLFFLFLTIQAIFLIKRIRQTPAQ